MQLEGPVPGEPSVSFTGSSLILQAGAGAGKTTRLISTFLQFAEDFHKAHGRYPKVVITTFTKKATQEVKERLLRKALEEKRGDVYQHIGKKSQVHISTIHGVLSLFLNKFGREIGLGTGFKIAQQSDLDWLAKRELRRCLNQNDKYVELLEDYTFFELWTAVGALREVRAGNAKAQRLTFEEQKRWAEAVAQELHSRAKGLARLIESQVTLASWLEWAEIFNRLPAPPPSEREGDWLAWISHLKAIHELRDFPRKSKNIGEALDEEMKEFRDLFWKPIVEEKTSFRFEPEFWRQNEHRSRLLGELEQEYGPALEKSLRERDWISMADLELKALEVLRSNEALARRFAQDWDYWMIDEYQDTSPVQVELLKHLVGDRPHFVVGDPQQSIYFFRGARSEVFFEKINEFKDGGHGHEFIGDNHRSRAPVLEFINAAFANKRAFSAMNPKSKRESDPERIAARLRAVAPLENGNDACALATVEEIQRLLKEGVRPESIGVLARKNSDLRQILLIARKAGVPVQLHAAGGFARRREVQDVLCFLKFLLNPSDNLNFLSLARSPWFAVSDETLRTYCQGDHFWMQARRLQNPEAPEEGIARLEEYTELAEERGLVHALRALYHREGLIDTSKYADPTERREANLWKLFYAFENALKEPGFNALSFIADYQYGSLADEENDAVPAIEPNRVQLMTVHASKGLEFEHVIVSHIHRQPANDRSEILMHDEATGRWTIAEKFADGKRKSTFLVSEITDERNRKIREENERLFYVALTRAMDRLTLIWEVDKRAPGATAWVSLLPLDLAPGMHRTEKFIYEVLNDAPAPLEDLRSEAAVVAVPPKWTAVQARESLTLSVTELLEDAGAIRATSKKTGIPRGRTVDALLKAQRGSFAHRVFEALKFQSEEFLASEEIDDDLRASAQWLLEQKQVPFREILTKGEVEWGFALREGERILQGQIDLWGPAGGDTWVVDYKTGSTDYKSKALEQIRLYARALKKMKRTSPSGVVHLVAVFPLEKKLYVETVTADSLESAVL